VDHRDLLAAYARAHVFVSMSEHEGFGVPVVEAMLMRVPVLAFASTAVVDTLDGAGVLFGQKRLLEVAEMAWRLARPGPLRDAVLAGQDRRLHAFSPPAVEAALRGYMDSL
jgi:glycosyltransferase involved in cell wall biosynthesis